MGLFSASSAPLPATALLNAYREDPRGFTDCYRVEVAGRVTLAAFVTAFYTTRLFKLERWILSWALGFQATDAEAAALGRGETERYSAWTVEARSKDQLLMRPVDEKTRSWFMVETVENGSAAQTRLYFGSAIVGRARPARRSGIAALAFSGLLGFHKLYSLALLGAARRSLVR